MVRRVSFMGLPLQPGDGPARDFLARRAGGSQGVGLRGWVTGDEFCGGLGHAGP